MSLNKVSRKGYILIYCIKYISIYIIIYYYIYVYVLRCVYDTCIVGRTV